MRPPLLSLFSCALETLGFWDSASLTLGSPGQLPCEPGNAEFPISLENGFIILPPHTPLSSPHSVVLPFQTGEALG